MLRALADLAHRRARRILALTVVLAVVAGVFGVPVTRVMKTGSDSFDDPAAQSARAQQALESATGSSPEPDVVALVQTGAPVRSPAGAARLRRIVTAAAGASAVAHVVSALDPRAAGGLVAADRRTTYVAIYLRPLSGDAAKAAAQHLQRRLAALGDVRVGGPVLAAAQVNDQVSADLRRAELLAFPLLFALALIVFRGVVAAALPLLVGGLAIVGTFLALRLVSELVGLSIFALNLVTGLGLGLAIDYSLFVVSRYREELARHGPSTAALRATMQTAGRTVAFSSVTVALALASLLVFPQRFLYSMGIGGVLVTLLAALAALLPLPAVLALLGDRVNALAPRRLQRTAPAAAQPASTGGWYRLAHAVMRRPVPVAAACAVLLIAIGLPALGLRFGGVDASLLPTSKSARQVADTLAREFPANQTAPVILAVHAPSTATGQLGAYTRALGTLPAVGQAEPPRAVGPRLWRVDLTSRAGPLAASSQQLVKRIRALPAPYPVGVTGQAARFYDRQASLGARLPLALGLLCATTLLVLFAMTDSVALPIKALVMNLLTLTGAYGLLVLIFQDGRLQGPLAYTTNHTLESTDMVLLFVVAFALSTDYGVFLLTRIKEAHDHGTKNADAVALGLQHTGPIVTAAALLFCVAIGAFATSQIVFIKELGVGAVFAVLIDATIIRAFLVPALMRLLGQRNWWAPTPLRRLHHRLTPHRSATDTATAG